MKNRQEEFKDLTSAPVLMSMILGYAGAMMSLFIFSFNTNYAFVSLVALCFCSIYFVTCWLNERLLEKYDDLRDTLYDLEWYTMKPWQRRQVAILMIMADRPILLKAGSFHVVNYERWGAFLNDVYSYGVFLNDFAKA